MEIKILVVSDTHAAYDVLDKVVEKEKEAIDCIIHSGDFANLQPDQKHLLEAQLEGLEVYENTIKILKKAGKPIVCVPGNVKSI
jgi:Icc-related predicted phosphoesterase